MATTLIQKHLFKGTYEYGIVGEQLNVRVKTPFKEEPPDWDEAGDAIARVKQDVDVEKLDTAIRMLQTHLDPAQTEPLITALEALRAAPKNEASLNKVASIFGEMGANQGQGAVLTYAPYIAILLSDDPFGKD